MLVLENKFVRRFRIHVHIISLIMISLSTAASQNKNLIMEIKQLSASRSDLLNTSVKGINPLVGTPTKIKLDAANISYLGNPTVIPAVNSNLNTNVFQTSISVFSNPRQMLKDTYNVPVIFKRTQPAASTARPLGFRTTANPIDIRVAPSRNDPQICTNKIGGTFCGVADDYPKKIVDRILKNGTYKAMFNKYFGNDTLIKDDIQIKSGPFDTDISKPVCAFEEQLFSPYKAENKNNEWRYILQGSNNESYQTIRVEVCSNPEEPCELIGRVANGYESKCVQKYIYRKLLYVADREQPDVDDFKIPSCCSCRYTSTDANFRIFTGSSSTKTASKPGG